MMEMMEMKPVQMRCSTCNSLNVRKDAEAEWDEDKQAWVLLCVYDNATCEKCEGECSLIETPIVK